MIRSLLVCAVCSLMASASAQSINRYEQMTMAQLRENLNTEFSLWAAYPIASARRVAIICDNDHMKAGAYSSQLMAAASLAGISSSAMRRELEAEELRCCRTNDKEWLATDCTHANRVEVYERADKQIDRLNLMVGAYHKKLAEGAE